MDDTTEFDVSSYFSLLDLYQYQNPNLHLGMLEEEPNMLFLPIEDIAHLPIDFAVLEMATPEEEEKLKAEEERLALQWNQNPTKYDIHKITQFRWELNAKRVAEREKRNETATKEDSKEDMEI